MAEIGAKIGLRWGDLKLAETVFATAVVYIQFLIKKVFLICICSFCQFPGVSIAVKTFLKMNTWLDGILI